MRGKLHDLARRQQLAGGFRARNHEVPEPGRQPVPGVVLHRLHLGSSAERVRDSLGGAFVIRRKAHPHMAVVEDRVVRAIGFLDLVQRLRDQEALETIARHEGQGRLEEVEPAQRRKLVEHQEQPMPPRVRLQILGQAAADLIQQQSHQGLGAVDVGGRHDEVERGRLIASHNVADAPV